MPIMTMTFKRQRAVQQTKGENDKIQWEGRRRNRSKEGNECRKKENLGMHGEINRKNNELKIEKREGKNYQKNKILSLHG